MTAATAFATLSARSSESELAAAPVRYPRPSRLAQPLQVEGAKAAHGGDDARAAHRR